MNNAQQESKVPLSSQKKAAQAEIERALSLHFQGNKTGALKSLRKALELDPDLSKDVLTSNLIRELTGAQSSDGLDRLVGPNAGKKSMETVRRESKRTPSMRRERNYLPLLAVISIVALGLLLWVGSGGMSPQPEKASLGGYDYYLSIPTGRAPEGGYPLVVAFHGYGGDGSQMLSLAGTFNKAGAIFVAPSLGGYDPNPGDGPLRPVSRILSEVGKEYPLQSRGAILLGFSQGGSFAYRFSVYYPKQVAGVVTAGAPEFDSILPTRNIPYVFTWGEFDDLQGFVMPSVSRIQNRGFNVTVVTVPGVGHTISQYAVDQVLLLLEQ